MNRSGKLHALLSTARVANIPSVVSNVWLGIALAMVLGGNAGERALPWFTFFQLSVAGVALYVSGNFLNDWMDRDWDAANRPERALPRGIFSPAVYLAVSVQLAVLGIAVAASVNLLAAAVACVILALVLVYTWCHKKAVWSVIPMGLCRALLPIMGAAGMLVKPVVSGVATHTMSMAAIAAIAVFSYIVGLSIAARSESKAAAPDGTRRRSRGLLVIPPAVMLLLFEDGNLWMWWIGIIPYAIWLAFCDLFRVMKLFRYVSNLLAGIPLVDWIFLLPTGFVWLRQHGATDSFGIACLIIPPLAFVSALLLQRLAPAT
jgi:4-hydroxybenzoate polyprenyltransferase